MSVRTSLATRRGAQIFGPRFASGCISLSMLLSMLLSMYTLSISHVMCDLDVRFGSRVRPGPGVEKKFLPPSC